MGGTASWGQAPQVFLVHRLIVISTADTELAQQILNKYQKRWPVEVDNYYVKQLLGLGDSRVQSYEAMEKWFALVFLAYTFLQWRLNHAAPEENFKTIADAIRTHRQEHARHMLGAACEKTSFDRIQPLYLSGSSVNSSQECSDTPPSLTQGR